MTSTTNTPIDTNIANVSTTTDTSEQAIPSNLKLLLKEALANKKEERKLPKQDKGNDKTKKIGMPPKGTRRSMGKR